MASPRWRAAASVAAAAAMASARQQQQAQLLHHLAAPSSCIRGLATVAERPSGSAGAAASMSPLLQGVIGFVGTGAMGGPMAASLLRSGLRVLAYDRNPAALRRVVDLGAAAAASPKAIAETPGVTAVVTMLPSTEHVADAFEGPQGLLRAEGGLQPALLVDCSTAAPTATRALADRIDHHALLAPGARPVPNARRAGPVFVDAPVSGGVPAAVAATLTHMAGGSELAVAAATPLLLRTGSRVFHVGGPGAGQVAKLCNNLSMAVAMCGVSEALALGVAAGLDAARLREVVNASSGRCWASEVYPPVPGLLPDVPSSRGYAGGFSAALMVKDLRLAAELAAATGRQPTPMAERAALLYRAVLDATRGEQRLDFSAVYEYVYHRQGGGGGGGAATSGGAGGGAGGAGGGGGNRGRSGGGGGGAPPASGAATSIGGNGDGCALGGA